MFSLGLGLAHKYWSRHSVPAGYNVAELANNAEWTPPATQLAVTPNELTSGAGGRNLDIKTGRYGLCHPHSTPSIQYTLTLNKESDHNGDTKGTNEEDVTTDSDVHYEQHDCHDTLEGETISCKKP